MADDVQTSLDEMSTDDDGTSKNTSTTKEAPTEEQNASNTSTTSAVVGDATVNAVVLQPDPEGRIQIIEDKSIVTESDIQEQISANLEENKPSPQNNQQQMGQNNDLLSQIENLLQPSTENIDNSQNNSSLNINVVINNHISNAAHAAAISKLIGTNISGAGHVFNANAINAINVANADNAAANNAIIKNVTDSVFNQIVHYLQNTGSNEQVININVSETNNAINIAKIVATELDAALQSFFQNVQHTAAPTINIVATPISLSSGHNTVTVEATMGPITISGGTNTIV